MNSNIKLQMKTEVQDNSFHIYFLQQSHVYHLMRGDKFWAFSFNIANKVFALVMIIMVLREIGLCLVFNPGH